MRSRIGMVWRPGAGGLLIAACGLRTPINVGADCTDDAPACDECVVWERHHDGMPEAIDYFADVAIDPQTNNAIAVGYENRTDGETANSLIVAYDGGGQRIWSDSFDAGADERATSVAVVADRIVVGVNVMEAEASWGELLVYRGPGPAKTRVTPDFGSGSSKIHDLAALPDGNVVFVGEADAAGWMRVYSISEDTVERIDLEGSPSALFGVASNVNGDIVAGGATGVDEERPWIGVIRAADKWSTFREFEGFAEGVAFAGNGDTVVVGLVFDDEHGSEAWAERLTSEATSAWAARFPGSGCCTNWLEAVVVADEGSVIATGVRGSADGGAEIVTWRLGCDGEIVWEAVHRSPGPGRANAGGVAIARHGDVVVVGRDDPDPTTDDRRAWIGKYRGL